MKHALRHRNGRFARNPVTPEQFRDRVGQIIYRNPGTSMAAAEQQAATELRLRLICDDITGEVVDFHQIRKHPQWGYVQ